MSWSKLFLGPAAKERRKRTVPGPQQPLFATFSVRLPCHLYDNISLASGPFSNVRLSVRRKACEISGSFAYHRKSDVLEGII